MRAEKRKDALQISAQLNRLLLISTLVLLLSTVILSGGITYLAINQPRTLVPPVITQEATVSRQSVSDGYLNLMTEYVILLKLNITPENVGRNYQQLLDYVSSEHYHYMQSALLAEATEIKERKISSFFTIEGIEISNQTLSAKVSGRLQKYVGARPLEGEYVTYKVQFSYPAGVIALDAITRDPQPK